MNDQNIKRNISENIAFYRKSNAMTQAYLADQLSVKSTTVSTWERGASLPDAETLFAMCKLFNISLSEMYGADSSRTISMDLSAAEKDLINAYRNAPESRREAVRALLELN